jgi:phage FluMu protein Com
MHDAAQSPMRPVRTGAASCFPSRAAALVAALLLLVAAGARPEPPSASDPQPEGAISEESKGERMVSFRCANCGKSIQIAEQYARQQVTCPECRQLTSVQIPTQSPGKPPTKTSKLGVVALVLGILALMWAWVPAVGMVTLPVSLIGLVLAIAGLFAARIGQQAGIGIPLAAVFVCGIAIFVPFISWNIYSATRNAQSKSAPVVHYEPPPPVPTKPPSLLDDVPKERFKLGERIPAGPVEIQVVSASVTRPQIKSKLNDEITTADRPALVVKVAVHGRAGAETKAPFRTWNGAVFGIGAKPARVIDEENKQAYACIEYGIMNTLVGAAELSEVAVGAVVEDTVAFEPPPADAKALLLVLPLENVREKGAIAVEIAADQVARD